MIQMSNTPAPHVAGLKQSLLDLYRGKATSSLNQSAMHRPIPAPEPNPEPNPGPDGVTQTRCTSHDPILPADWDALFRAVEVRLENCVNDAVLKTPELALHNRYAATYAAVLDCVVAMQQLHASLKLERQQWQLQSQAQQRFDQRPEQRLDH